MFVNLPTHPDPAGTLAISFDARFRALQRGKRKVAYYYDFPDTSTFRYRVLNMMEAISGPSGNPDISASWFHVRDSDQELDDVVSVCDLLIVCRARYSGRLNHLITRARNRGLRIYFDTDDLVFDSTYAHLVAHTVSADMRQDHVYDQWFGYIGRVSATMQMCDLVITTNAQLAHQVRQCGDLPTAVIPNFLNRAQLDISTKIFAAKKSSGFARNGFVHIGYFSGSPSHNRDLAIAAPAIVALMKDDPRIRLRLAGYIDCPPCLNAVADRIERLEFQDYVLLQSRIGETELNIVPLQDNVFTNCKSDLKYFEAAAAGTLSVASPTFAFKKSITDGANGWLAQPQDWQEKLTTAVQSLQRGAKDYASMATRARKHALTHFSPEAQAPALDDLLIQ